MDFGALYQKFRVFLLEDPPISTDAITARVKKFFEVRFSEEFQVLCSGQHGTEYLCDVLVSNFQPLQVVERVTLNVLVENPAVHLAAESELGGSGASSAYGVMKNVAEDFLKLLIINARFRVIVFTSLPYRHERDQDFVASRVQTLRDIYDRALPRSEGMLLVHMRGSQPRSQQVQANVDANSIRGFVFGCEPGSIREIAA